MNKFISLGILLLVGLSFAGTDGCNWMGYAESKYACNFFYNAGGYPPADGGMGLMQIVGNYDSGCIYWTGCRDMGFDLKDMQGIIWNEGGMWDNGCYTGIGASGFRQNILAYSIASADFKAKFLAGLRSYLAAHPGNRTSLTNDLTDARGNYMYCLSDVPCCYNPR